MPYTVKVNFVDAFESHKHPRAEVRPHLGKFVRKGTRVGTAVSVKQAVAGALQTLRNMPATAKINPVKATAEAVELLDHESQDEACCDLCAAGELCDKHGTPDAKWDEGKHPRGQPDNPGQFSKGGAPGPSPHPQSKPQKEIHKIATEPGEAPEKISAIKKVMQAYSVPKGGFAEKFGQQWIATLSEGVKEPAPAPPATPTAAPKAEHEGSFTQTFNKQNLPASSLNGIPFQHWSAPKTNGAWNALAKKTEIDEPPFPKSSLPQGAGVIIQESDGRVWIIHPTNAYGGYAATFPKGGVEKGMTPQATALKEAYEESGLQVELTGFAGDIKRTTSQARYYFAKRVGGTPVDAGWETDGVTLAPVEELFDHLNVPRDQQMAANFLGASPPPPMKLSDMKKSGTQLGSNPGGKYTAPNGKQYYVKLSKSDSHAKNEILASALYEAAGSPVLKAKLFDNDGKLATGTEWQSITPINRHDPKQREQAQRHFATHAWLANWDAAGLEYDNQGTAENGKMTTLDPGGSLLYRAQGGPKGNAFGDEVGEWDSLRDPNNKQAHTIFGSMTPEQLKKSAARIGLVPDSIINDLTMLHGPGDESQRKALAKRILARKYDILKKAKALKVPKKTGDAEPRYKFEVISHPQGNVYVNPHPNQVHTLMHREQYETGGEEGDGGHLLRTVGNGNNFAVASGNQHTHGSMMEALETAAHPLSGENITHLGRLEGSPKPSQYHVHKLGNYHVAVQDPEGLDIPHEEMPKPMSNMLKPPKPVTPKNTGDSLHHVMLRVRYGV